MTLAAILIMAVASIAAAACAYADGALLGVDDDEPIADDAVRNLVARRDRIHRALAFARVALQLGAGTACGVALATTQGIALVPLVFVAFIGVALVVLSETTARDVGEYDAERGVLRARWFIELIERGLMPVVAMGSWFETSLDRWLPSSAETVEERREESIERFRQVVANEADVGVRTAPLLTGVFALGDTTVGEVMTPRVDMIGIEQDAPWAEVVDRVRSSAHSRVLVHDGSMDGVVGLLFAKDLLPHVVADAEPEAGWNALIRPATFIPASKLVDAQLRDFRASGLHIAIVADEFGGTAGLVTIEDLLELIVGEINDEHDTDEPEVESEPGDRWWLAGRLSLDQVSELIGDDLVHDDVSTVGGLAYELFGRVPRAGEKIEWRGWRLVMERVRRRRVERVYMERVPAAFIAEDAE
jgi:CBS domain containing-hemolysin-like protein